MEVRELEERERALVVRSMLLLVIACVFIDICFFVFYYLTHNAQAADPVQYVLLRIVSPFTLNLLSFLVARLVNSNEKATDQAKTYVCCFALLTIAGSMSFFHSYFVVLLCAPALCMTFSTVFHDRKLMVLELIYCLILIYGSSHFIMLENPDKTDYYTEQMVVAICMTLLFTIVAFAMEAYSSSVVLVLQKSNTKQEEYKEQLDVDWLTGVFSRSYFQTQADRMLKRCRGDNPVTFAVIDIDDFKSVNDTYGHENGDEVLVNLGRLIKEYNSDKCYTGRYGGEEFVFVFEGDDARTHRRILEEIRERFSLQHYKFMEKSVTFSCGMITVYQPEKFENVFAKADQNLYISKGKGKNCVTA